MENASRRYTYEHVRHMIERQKERYHWEFLFLGANIDAVRVADRFGIRANRAVRYEHDGAGTRLNYEVLSDVVVAARQAPSMAKAQAVFDDEDLFQRVREDFDRRHKKR